jgi:protein TonB
MPARPPRDVRSPHRIQGIVVIEAIIDEHGNVVQEKAISGHPSLVQAAMKAVSVRKYEATILDGTPMPMDLRVEITFHEN